VLGEQQLDLGDARARPVLEPGVAEIVLDEMEAALAHGHKYRLRSRGMPWAKRLIREPAGPSSLAAAVAGFLLINPRSGSGSPDAGELAAAAEQRGIKTHVLREGENPADLARAARADALGIAGGDGSLAAVAEVAIERGLPFVCVPFGTRNHFARDLGLDRDDPEGALEAFAGVERRIDVGRANGRLFLNNVSLGLYARLVHRRERHRRRREALARIRAWAMLLRPHPSLRVTIDGQPVETRLVLVGNNAYDLELPSLGERKRLDEGKLHLYTPGADPAERTADRFAVEAATERLEAAVDGEPTVVSTPLDFRIEPLALRILVPGDRD
jgi:diacylglycerol kinase family enzyme